MIDGVIVFLFTAVVISLSGVMAPGPMTAATLAAGTRLRHAGALIALGHAAVEFPLMLLIITGIGSLLQLEGVKTGIGLAGGAFLLLMGVELLVGARKSRELSDPADRRHPVLIGIVLTAANPYFLIWWATVGLALATQAVQWGVLAFALFAVIHWLCDLVWLEALSLASFKGSQLLGGWSQRIVLAVCGVMLLLFGCKFIADAGGRLFDPEKGISPISVVPSSAPTNAPGLRSRGYFAGQAVTNAPGLRSRGYFAGQAVFVPPGPQSGGVLQDSFATNYNQTWNY